MADLHAPDQSSSSDAKSIDESPETLGHKPEMGGGMPLVQYWAQKTLSPQGPQIWKTLLHKSTCLSSRVDKRAVSSMSWRNPYNGV